MIDYTTIQKILDTAEIQDVISDFISLKKRGVNYIGLCPFHNEKTPSFTVSPAKGIFKCFGCGKGGNSVNFIMEHEQQSYPEALKFLAKKYNIEIVEKELTPEDVKKQNEKDSLFIVNTYAQKYFSDILHKHEQGRAIALSYFREREFRDDIIEKFGLGYCLDEKDAFTQSAQKNSYKLDYLVKTGLTYKRDNYTADRFRGRIIFPIFGLSGKVVAFGGRTMKSDLKGAKYVNSPESEIYHKSYVLYGLYQAKNEIIKNNKCYIVEGYTDVISVYQSGIKNIVASSGTALSVEQIRLIKRFTKNITIIFDGDEAGIKASIRGIDLILEEGLNVKVISLPDGEDPDSYSKKLGGEEFEKFLKKNEKDFISFKIHLLLEETKNDPVKKSMLIRNIVSSISVIPDTITRSVYIKECSKLMDVREQVLYSETNKTRRQNYEKRSGYKTPEYIKEEISQAPIQEKVRKYDFNVEEKEIIRLMINYGDLDLFRNNEDENEPAISVAQYIISELENDELVFLNPEYNTIYQEIKEHIDKGEYPDTKVFTNHPDEKIALTAVDLLTTNYILSKIHVKGGAQVRTEEKKLKEIVPNIILVFKWKKVLENLHDNREKISGAMVDDNTELTSILYKKYNALLEIQKTLAHELGKRTIIK
ncbi:DNA primase [Bacteroidota bacterium]